MLKRKELDVVGVVGGGKEGGVTLIMIFSYSYNFTATYTLEKKL